MKTESVTSTDPTTLGDVLERLERYAPPSRMACIRGPRNAPGELWIEMFDGQVMIAGQAAGTPPDKPITLPRSASTQMAKMLNRRDHHIPGERVVLRRGMPGDGLDRAEMLLERPRPGTDGATADRFTSGRIQWAFTRAATPELMRSAYEKLQRDELAGNQIEIGSLRKFVAVATALAHREVMFTPETDPSRYTAQSIADAGPERARAEMAVNGAMARGRRRDDCAEQREVVERRGLQPRRQTAPEERVHHRHPHVPAAEHQQLTHVHHRRDPARERPAGDGEPSAPEDDGDPEINDNYFCRSCCLI